MRAVLGILSLALISHASDAGITSLVAKLQAERQRKAALISELSGNEMFKLEEQTGDSLPVFVDEAVQSEGLLSDARLSVADQMMNARNKLSEAEAMEKKVASMENTLLHTQDKLDGLTSASSLLEQQKTLRDRDSSFVQQEINRINEQKNQLQKQAESATQEKLSLAATAQAMKAQAQKDLNQAEKQWSGVEAVVQQNEARPSHIAPIWMVEAQLQEAKEAHSETGAKIQSDKQELRMQKSYMWNQMGKKYTCSAEHPQVKAIIIDSQQDGGNRADCLEKQLDKYCLDALRVPAVSKEAALNLITDKKDCMANGVDDRVPENRRAAVASQWCNVVRVLQGVAAQPLSQKYFVMLEDKVKVDPTNFEETLKSFADSHHHNWDLLQVDPLGKHNEEDKIDTVNGNNVYKNSRNGQYFGFNSVMLKTTSAGAILEQMMAMPAVPLDTLPTLLNEKNGKLSAASLKADVVNVLKQSSLLQKNTCSEKRSGLAQLEEMYQVAKPASLLQTSTEKLDYFAFEREQGAETFKNWENRDM